MARSLPTLTLPQARALQAWIASGAEGPDTCPDVSACLSRNDPETDKASGGAGLVEPEEAA